MNGQKFNNALSDVNLQSISMLIFKCEQKSLHFIWKMLTFLLTLLRLNK